MKKDEFYIGWKDDLPSGQGRFAVIAFSTLVLLVLLFTLLWILKSDGFMASRFDYGNETIYKGVIHEYPAPMIVVMEGSDSVSIPLVNFGKFGVSGPLQFFNSQMRNNLRRYEVEIKGTKIEFDGKIWLELTSESDALLSFEKLETESPSLHIKDMGYQELVGEIVDPKCFFGVMKPGFGKVHLSCAVRCISGGVPPILVTPEIDGGRSYYFVTGIDGMAMNDFILPYVGIPVKLSGTVKKVGGWDVIEIGGDDISVASITNAGSIFSTCVAEKEYDQVADLTKSQN